MDSVKIPGVLVKVHDTGVFIRGASGSGKTLAALGLMRRGHYFVADDVVEIYQGPGGTLIGQAVESEPRIEIRGVGVFRAASLFPDQVIDRVRLDFAVLLDSYEPSVDAGRINPETSILRLLGRDLTCVRVPLADGMDPALIIEILARRFKETGTVTG